MTQSQTTEGDAPVTAAAEIPADAEALFRLVVEILAPAQRAELVRLLLEDGS